MIIFILKNKSPGFAATPPCEKEDTMIEIGRVCIKIAGRDAGLKCVVVDVLDRTFVLVDGETRRKRCNILHLEPMDKFIDIQKGASHEAVASALKKEGIDARNTTPKQAGPKPIKKRKSSEELRQGKEQKKAPKAAAAPKKKEQVAPEAKAVADDQSTKQHKPAKKPAAPKKTKAE